MAPAKSWWVIPEGTLGQILDAFSINGITHLFGATGNQAVWTVTQAASKPAHAANEGPFATRAQAQAAATALNQKENIASDVQQALGSGDQPSSPSQLASVPGLSQIGDFFSRLTQGNTWIRVGEVLIGVLLIAVGVARITKAVPAATAIARTVGGAAI